MAPRASFDSRSGTQIFAEQLVQTLFSRRLIWLVPILIVVLLLIGAVVVTDMPTALLSFPHRGGAG